MSYTLEFSVVFRNQPSLTLNAKLYDATGAQVGATITSGFVNLGNGAYSYLATIPANHVGTLVIYDSTAPERGIALAINPQELENADAKTSLIKVKTDNLPADPADASDIAASFSAITATLTTIAGYIDTEVAAIKAKTDNLPSDPADASDIAASFSAVTATLATISGYIDTEIAAIKAKTDNLPAAPAAVSDIPTTTAINTALSTAHGAGSWATATGFATPTNVTTAQTVITAAIAALHNLSTGDIDARLTAYDGATQADLDTAKAAVLAAIAALNNLSQTQAQAAATAALNDYDGPTKAELDAAQAAIQTDIAGIEGGGGGGGFTLEQFWTYTERTLTRFGRLTGVEFTYTVTSSANGLPIPSVAVWFAADGGGTQIVWSGYTDALGIARDVYGALPRLDPGTYYVFRRRPGYIFRNPDTEIVNE